jgi:antirestriction protein ArdC
VRQHDTAPNRHPTLDWLTAPAIIADRWPFARKDGKEDHMATVAPAAFADLLQKAVTEPGIISKAYSAFHGYSIGNQILALVQCVERGITPGPIATFVGWKAKGRYVRKGEKAIVLCMPVTCKRKVTEQRTNADETDDKQETFTRFVYRPNWFVLAQTEGPEMAAPPIPDWDQARALDNLGITEEPFSITDGNCQGYARQRTIAVSPVAELPHKTRFHELAHVVLGHTSEADAGLTDSDITPRSLREVEAEAAALVCLEALGLAGAEHCRGYIQHWNQGRDAEPIPERNAQRIFKAADQILKAGSLIGQDGAL